VQISNLDMWAEELESRLACYANGQRQGLQRHCVSQQARNNQKVVSSQQGAAIAGAPQQRKRKPPRTHMHAELVARRRDPAPSPKDAVREALKALSTSTDTGDSSAIEALLARPGEEVIVEEWQTKYKSGKGGQLYWDHFYEERTINFFKDRHYLREEFAELMPEEVLADPRQWVEAIEVVDPVAPPRARAELLEAMRDRAVLLEVGCAVGNGVIPLLRANTGLFALACDLSPVAVRLLQEKEEYRCGRCLAFSSDIAQGSETQPTAEHQAIEEVVPEASVDFTTLLFVLSAIDPSSHRAVIARLRSRLRPGGLALFRDYGRGDLAQLRFAKGHWLGGDLYVRGDGTLAYFFTIEGLREAFEAEGFETVECEYKRNEVVNRGTGVRMPRVWVQGKFRRRP